MRRNGCAWCGSPEIEFELDRYLCLACGEHTDMNGNKIPAYPKFHGVTRDQFAVRGSGRP